MADDPDQRRGGRGDVRSLFRSRPVVGLAVAALLAYAPAVWWGVPRATSPDLTHAWGVDDVTPLGSLAQVHNIVEPKEFQNYGYPLLHPFMVVGAFAPYLGVLYLTGGFESPSAEYPFGLSRPVESIYTMGVIAHLVSVVLGVGIVIAAYVTATTLWGTLTGMVAGILALLSYPMFYYARTGNVDVPVVFFIAAALASFARIVVHGLTMGRAVALGVFVGLALATKEPAFASFLLIPPAIVVLEWSRFGSDGLKARRFWRPVMGGALASFFVFGLGSGLFVDPDWYFEHVRFASGRVAELAAGDIADIDSYPATWSGHVALAGFLTGKLADAMTPIGVALAAVGVWVAGRRERRTLWLVLPALSYLFVLFWMVRSGTLRYIMPASWPLLLYAARAVTAGVERGGLWRPAAMAAGAATMLLSGLQGLDLTHAMLFDSRYRTSAWLAETAAPGDRLAYFGASQKLPYLEAGVEIERAAEYRGAVYSADRSAEAVATIADSLRSSAARFVIVIPDHSSLPGEEHSASCPPEILARLGDGSLGYRLAFHAESRRLFPWLPRPALDYPSVNPPIRVFVRNETPETAS